jgi:hypothetical protein
MTFAFPPARPGGAPVFNFRSEGRHFANSNRCLIPASAFFEFTGKKYPKAKHRFALKDSSITAIAGLWRDAQSNHPPTFTMLTTAPGPSVVALGAPVCSMPRGVVAPVSHAWTSALARRRAVTRQDAAASSLSAALNTGAFGFGHTGPGEHPRIRLRRLD